MKTQKEFLSLVELKKQEHIDLSKKVIDKVMFFRNNKEEFKKLNSQEQMQHNNLKSQFFEQKRFEIEVNDSSSIEELEQSIKKFKQETRKLKNKLDFRSFMTGSAYPAGEDDADFEYLILRATWTEQKSQEHIESIAYNKARTFAKSELTRSVKIYKGIAEQQYVNIDCKLVQLWLDEKIDFDTLATILTANCKL